MRSGRRGGAGPGGRWRRCCSRWWRTSQTVPSCKRADGRARGAGRQVAPVLQQVVEAYGCSLVEGVLSHQLKQFVIDGNKCILNKVPPAPPRALHARQQERAGGGRRSSSKQGSWRFSSHRVPRDLGCSHRSRFVQ